jgi:hypothetical protein
MYARQRADEEALRVPWRRLVRARNRFIEWYEFNYWARSIIEVENSIPPFLAREFKRRCPGFLAELKCHDFAGTRACDPLRLSKWIDENIFGFAEREGWMNAIRFYAFRDPRYQRASVHWSECVKEWSRSKPARYPSFKRWLRDAARCDEDAGLLPEVRKARACLKLVASTRLKRAVERYVEWEAFSYWVRSPLEARTPLPPNVETALRRRCPGFLEAEVYEGLADPEKRERLWGRLLSWIADRHFTPARTEGWLPAILLCVSYHARAIRTMEYWYHWDEEWRPEKMLPYPSFREWRRVADHYVEVV